MKRFFLFLTILLISYVIYVDLSKGVLPSNLERMDEETVPVEANTKISFFEVEVGRGDTVISIIEKYMEESINIPIDQIVEDFRELNNGLPPEEIQVGKTYKFPNYGNHQQ